MNAQNELNKKIHINYRQQRLTAFTEPQQLISWYNHFQDN